MQVQMFFPRVLKVNISLYFQFITYLFQFIIYYFIIHYNLYICSTECALMFFCSEACNANRPSQPHIIFNEQSVLQMSFYS